MRYPLLLLTLLIPLAAACSDATAPTGDAYIVFRPDPASCAGAHAFTLFIDGDHVGNRSMAPGDSASFTVEPGPHAIGAVATTDFGFAVSFSRVVPLKAGDRYVPMLGC